MDNDKQMSTEKKVLIPNYSRWQDANGRLFVNLGAWWNEGDIIRYDLLSVAEEKVIEQPVKTIEDLVRDGKLTRVLS